MIYFQELLLFLIALPVTSLSSSLLLKNSTFKFYYSISKVKKETPLDHSIIFHHFSFSLQKNGKYKSFLGTNLATFKNV